MTPTPIPFPLPPDLFAAVPAWVLGILLGIALIGVIRLRIWWIHRTDRAAAQSAMEMADDLASEDEITRDPGEV